MKPLKYIKVREYGLLVRGGEEAGLDISSIPASAFDWLLTCGQGTGEGSRDLVKIKRYQNSIALQVINFVGVLETPCGVQIEILPKVTHEENAGEAQNILLKMLKTVFKLPMQQFHHSNLRTIKGPLCEILISQFLRELSQVIRIGVCCDYKKIDACIPYLKGKLNVAKQMRQRPGRNHYFHVSYDKYTPDRPENRLIFAALLKVLKWSKNSANQKFGKKLVSYFEGVQCSGNYELDFKLWATDRTLAHYSRIKPWCRLILSYQTPLTLSGSAQGISFLFAMEKLFENYVAIMLRRQMPQYQHRSQVRYKYLLKHNNEDMFQLRPDIEIRAPQKLICIADTKWKLLDVNSENEYSKYGIHQSDLYQMFAYGHKYLNGDGVLCLIYPQYLYFNAPLQPFYFSDKLKLHVIPYDLRNDTCPLLDYIDQPVTPNGILKEY